MFKLYHSTNCSKSRKCLDILKQKKIKFELIEYVKKGLTKEELTNITNKLDCSALHMIRDQKLKLKNNKEIIEFILKNPNQMQRPIFYNGEIYSICRPPEKVLKLIF